MKINVGDKILMKKVEDLPKEIKDEDDFALNDYEKDFAGKVLTVKTILKKKPLVIEVEEDEDYQTGLSMLLSAIADFDEPSTKRCHFSEKFIEKVLNEETDNTGHSFGWALYRLKEGKKVARTGWNGKGQFVYYVPAGRYKALTDAAKSIAEDDGKVSYNHYMALRTVQGAISTWVPSVTDCLAEDWVEVE